MPVRLQIKDSNKNIRAYDIMKVRFLFRVFLSVHLWTLAFSGTRLFRTRIIGGRSAQPGSWPYVVSVQNDFAGHYCGGSLIGRDVVLTAAHCGDVLFDEAIIGRHELSTNEGEELEVAYTVPHPDYNVGTNLNNDVMLIFLDEPADQSVELVQLNSNDFSPEVGSPITVAGWGRTETDEAWRFSNQLMTVEVNAISNTECEQSEGFYNGAYANYVGQITRSMVCAKGDGKDTCNGDSGGPLVLQSSDGSADVQVGLVSGGIGCALPDFPGVYTRISVFYDWIKEEVCERSSYPPAEFECGIEVEVHWSNDYDGHGSNDLALYNHMLPFPTPKCTDTAGWKDSFNDGCSWYETYDNPGCPLYGNEYGGSLGMANNNCCHCMMEEIR